jgi:hypothetical protein
VTDVAKAYLIYETDLLNVTILLFQSGLIENRLCETITLYQDTFKTGPNS